MKLGLLMRMTAIIVLFDLFYVAPVHPQDASVARFPNRPITYIIPLPAGGDADVATRLLAREAGTILGQPIVVVNKPGGALTIGISAIAAAKPDGYTIGYTGPSGMLIVPFMEKLSYHPLKDFQQIMQWGSVNFAVSVRADSPFKSFKDIVAYARQNPNKLNYGTSGNLSVQFLLMDQIARREKVRFTQVPYRGGVEVEAAILGGFVDFGASGFTTSQVDAGKIRLLFLIREEPSAGYPEIPVLKDVGYGDMDAPVYLSVAGPAGLPPAIAEILEDAFTRAMREPAFVDRMNKFRLTIVHRNSREMTEYIARNYENYGKLLKELGIAKN